MATLFSPRQSRAGALTMSSIQGDTNTSKEVTSIIRGPGDTIRPKGSTTGHRLKVFIVKLRVRSQVSTHSSLLL